MLQSERERFMITWEKIVESFQAMKDITEANRRLLSGITTALIEKKVISSDDVKKIEDDVKISMSPQGGKEKNK